MDTGIFVELLGVVDSDKCGGERCDDDGGSGNKGGDDDRGGNDDSNVNKLLVCNCKCCL